ncbi:MAG: hypothetical protein LUF34_02975, partial [Lachnospiraceae bacterium]|nr:hypothetical protein [Lachnospiraceae bacterium]
SYPNVIPGFSIYYILMVYDHMMYFGDSALVAEHMPTMDLVLHYFERHLTPEGYVEKGGGVLMEARFWSFIDWADDWNDTSGMPTAGLRGPLTMETLLYIYGLQHAAELAEYLGRAEEAQLYRARAERAQEAVRTYCMGENGLIQDGPGIEEYSQHCQVFALLTDTVDPEQGKSRSVKDDRGTRFHAVYGRYAFLPVPRAGEDRTICLYRPVLGDLEGDGAAALHHLCGIRGLFAQRMPCLGPPDSV